MTEEERRPEKRALRKEMPFLEHLEELRSVLFQVAVAVMALAVACGGDDNGDNGDNGTPGDGATATATPSNGEHSFGNPA